MKDYWNNRFTQEERIWGTSPSNTAAYTLELFKKHNISKILIPGIGYGRNADLFLQNNFIVHGIEISEKAISLIKEENPALKIFHGSVIDMPFSNDTYDGIYCFNTLHLLIQKDRLDFINKCYTQLNNNGIAVFAVFSEKEPSYGRGSLVEESTYESKPGRPVHYFTEEDLVSHFKDFTVIETGLMEDHENHGEEGPHTHIVRYISAVKACLYY